MVQLPVSRDVNIRQKSNMAAAKVKCTYFTAVWLTEDNFKYPVGDFQCPHTGNTSALLNLGYKRDRPSGRLPAMRQSELR